MEAGDCDSNLEMALLHYLTSDTYYYSNSEKK